MAKLILISSDERQEFELAAFNSIGRHPDNTIQILDRIISKEHAQIQRTPEGRFLLRDLGSLNGTYIRGDRVHEHVLADGDEISLGSTRLLFVDQRLEDPPLSRVTIAPGDLLTSSDLPGYAMKASDRSRAAGAVIGKSMTGLESGTGLVLVLVSLQ